MTNPTGNLSGRACPAGTITDSKDLKWYLQCELHTTSVVANVDESGGSAKCANNRVLFTCPAGAQFEVIDCGAEPVDGAGSNGALADAIPNIVFSKRSYNGIAAGYFVAAGEMAISRYPRSYTAGSPRGPMSVIQTGVTPWIWNSANTVAKRTLVSGEQVLVDIPTTARDDVFVAWVLVRPVGCDYDYEAQCNV